MTRDWRPGPRSMILVWTGIRYCITIFILDLTFNNVKPKDCTKGFYTVIHDLEIFNSKL